MADRRAQAKEQVRVEVVLGLLDALHEEVVSWAAQTFDPEDAEGLKALQMLDGHLPAAWQGRALEAARRHRQRARA